MALEIQLKRCLSRVFSYLNLLDFSTKYAIIVGRQGTLAEMLETPFR